MTRPTIEMLSALARGMALAALCACEISSPTGDALAARADAATGDGAGHEARDGGAEVDAQVNEHSSGDAYRDAAPSADASPRDGGAVLVIGDDASDGSGDGAACSAGQYACDGLTPLACEDGVLVPSAGPCATPAWVCREGACVPNDIVLLGPSVPTASHRTLAASHLHASSVSTTTYSQLQQLGLLGEATGGNVRLAVYTDRIEGGVHVPDELVVQGYEAQAVQANVAATTPPQHFTELEAGTRFWVVAATSSVSVRVYTTPDDDARVLEVPFPAGFVFAGSFPAVFPLEGANAIEGQRYGMFLGVQAAP